MEYEQEIEDKDRVELFKDFEKFYDSTSAIFERFLLTNRENKNGKKLFFNWLEFHPEEAKRFVMAGRIALERGYNINTFVDIYKEEHQEPPGSTLTAVRGLRELLKGERQ